MTLKPSHFGERALLISICVRIERTIARVSVFVRRRRCEHFMRTCTFSLFIFFPLLLSLSLSPTAAAVAGCCNSTTAREILQ
jgi:hypothetical protein